MKKPLNLGELSEQSLTKQKTIEDTVTAQIASELASLKQIIKDTVISEVQSFLSDLKETLKNDQSQLLANIEQSNQQVNQRIDSLINSQPLTERLDQVEQTLGLMAERLSQIDQKAARTIQAYTSQVEERMTSYAEQTVESLNGWIAKEEQDYQVFIRQQRQWRRQTTLQFLVLNYLPISGFILLFCLLALSVAINLTVLVKAELWSKFVGILVLFLLFLLVVWAIVIGYQIHQQRQTME